MLRSISLSLGIVALLALPALASTPKVGEAAPEMGDMNWIANAPAEDSIAKLRGEVVYIEAWGVN